jgi:hypothetical protein
MREEALYDFLRRAGVGWEVVETLLHSGQLIETDYRGKKFYLRKLR